MKPDRSPTPHGRQVKILERCLILLTSLVLTDPLKTPQQQREIGRLIKRLKEELS